MITTRLIAADDAPALADLLVANHEHLARWEPRRDPGYATVDGQRAAIDDALRQYEAGTQVPHVIVDDGRIVGRTALSSVIRGFFQSCSLSYWVAAADTGRGIGTTVARSMVRIAFDELDLHRVQAETLLDNTASQRVLERVGFTRIGVAPAFLKIAGRWQDHVLFQLVRPDGER
ncbi:GNAT family N-acetyltransferase [Actinocatenispora rupis]|uniref:Ribosomal-protein-alanine acetyltransferase n=1 Tax=Actinocatenispora rupis TaxID=519421 RepID=A0A8J3NEI1_9ACTN|nr:GNAT family protein [Actinocatenispora rupis]GID12599.1 ribosomal-protein-alanine acetyltransferase [Actinocatenispora rupis]